jgi:hypothetical protein
LAIANEIIREKMKKPVPVSTLFLDIGGVMLSIPVADGAVLPILHLNGYKIANPTILACISHDELDQLLRGYGWIPLYVEGNGAG